MQKASSHHVPSGFYRNYTPGLDAESARLARERDEVRSRDPNDPSLPDLNRQVAAAIAAASRKRWMETVADSDRKSNPKRHWNLLARLLGKRGPLISPNQPINFNGKTFSIRRRIANQFVKQYVNVKKVKSTKESRATYRNLKTENPLDPMFTPFSTTLTVEAIKATRNSTVAGPNGLTALHLKNIGHHGDRFLTRLFNLSVQNADIPTIWKSAIIIPVPKPGKPADQGNSYRPISLLAPEVKILERLILPALKSSLLPNDNQHGFRPNRSTITALMPLVTTTALGLNQRKPAARTGLLAVDFSKAFDVVEREKLLAKVNTTDLHPNLKRWLAAYLRDRNVRVLYQGAFSRWRKSKVGMPQGSVLSPVLYNFFTADMAVEAGDLSEGYADDAHSAASSPDVNAIADTLSLAAGEMDAWAKENGMSVSAEKSSVTLFTPWTLQVNHQLDVRLNGVQIPTDKNPKLLGVTFDPTFSFSAHAAAIARKAAQRINLLRALSNSSFGKDKECLLATYKMYIRSLFDYAAPLVFPYYSNTSILKLQRVQSRCLRLVLGCHSNSSVDHLHDEAKELPVEEHLRLLAAQFLARCLQESHPSHHYVTLERGPRPMKHTLRSKCIEEVRPFLDERGVIPPGHYPNVKKSLHTKIVAETLDSLDNNRVLNCRPPLIDKSEISLPRIVRVTLSQLRSGFCARLKTYQKILGKSNDDLCPECHSQPHSSQHLFECPVKPTQLLVTSLWLKPWDAARFLKSLSSFDFFPDIGAPPLQRRRPRPPPHPPDPDVHPFSPLSLPPSPFIFTPPPLTPPARGPPSLMSLVFPNNHSSLSDLFSSGSISDNSQVPRDARSDASEEDLDLFIESQIG